MTLKQVGSNMSEVGIGDKTVLYSYSTPVAYKEGGFLFVTNKYWSKTTSRHINKWLDGSKFETIPQLSLDTLV